MQEICGQNVPQNKKPGVDSVSAAGRVKLSFFDIYVPNACGSSIRGNTLLWMTEKSLTKHFRKVPCKLQEKPGCGDAAILRDHCIDYRWMESLDGSCVWFYYYYFFVWLTYTSSVDSSNWSILKFLK
ncbi:hypothetical protein AMECASPLE_000968 [Ameca splendens]|uniref:Uncharacterized protein n=1 Tax=Ameca splendens TaxID=208324 RepID=A0ABV0YKI7_9TELE